MPWFAIGCVLVVLIAVVVAVPLFRRAAQVAIALARRFSPRLLVKLGLKDRSYTKARALRLAFEDLGPTYIKFGQIIASSPTAFPDDVVAEFGNCLDSARPIPFSVVRQVVERELGASLDTHYKEFSPEPLASASIAQVHTATLIGGESVVVKIQRPRIAGRIEGDLRILAYLARRAMRRNEELRRANLLGVVEDFRSTLTAELDFQREAENIIAFTGLLEAEGLTEIASAPSVHDELSTTRVLTMSRLIGVRIDDKEGVDARIDDAVDMLRDTSKVFWTSVFLGGFFHGDIHAGNILVLDDGRLGYIDFGIFGRFDMNDRMALLEWLSALVANDGEQLARSIKRMGAVPDDIDWEAYVKDITESFLPLRELTVDKPEMLEAFLPRLREIAAKYDAHLPGNFVLILKQLAYFGRYVMIHHPSFNENVDPVTRATFMSIFARFHQLRASGEQAAAAS